MPWTHFDTFDDWADFRDEARVSKWPHPNTNRLKCEFRMPLGEGAPYPRPDKFIGAMLTLPNSIGGIGYPVIEMDGAGAAGLHGTSGLSWDDRSVELDIIEHPEADFPGSDSNGIEYHFVFKQIGRDDFNWTWYYERVWPVGVDRPIPMLAAETVPQNGVVVVKDDPQFLDVDWPPLAPGADWQWQPHGQCFVVPPYPEAELFAEFNGVDARIDLDHGTFLHQGPFRIEADIRIRDSALVPLLGDQDAVTYWGRLGAHGKWSFTTLVSVPWPADGTWFKYRLEFEWSSGLGLRYEVFEDDVNVWSANGGRRFTRWDILGVSNFDAAPVWGDFDMKNLKYWTGSFASPVLRLDMPLTENALDLSPDANHGTTYNMALPST